MAKVDKPAVIIEVVFENKPNTRAAARNSMVSRWMDTLNQKLAEPEVNIDDINGDERVDVLRQHVLGHEQADDAGDDDASSSSSIMEEAEVAQRKANNKKPNLTGVECCKCENILEDRVELRDHYRLSHGFTFFCKLPGCKEMYMEESGMIEHLQRSHGGNFNYIQCNECKYWTYREGLFLKHNPTHTIKKVNCEKCSQVFYSIEDCKLHLDKVHRDSFQCVSCDQPMTMQELKEHTRNTTCSICECVFRCQKWLNEHHAEPCAPLANDRLPKKIVTSDHTMAASNEVEDAVACLTSTMEIDLETVDSNHVDQSEVLNALEEFEKNLNQGVIQNCSQRYTPFDEDSCPLDDSEDQLTRETASSSEQSALPRVEKRQDHLYALADEVVERHRKRDEFNKMTQKGRARHSKYCLMVKTRREAGLEYERRVKHKDGSVTLVQQAGKTLQPCCGPEAICRSSKNFFCNKFTQGVREKIFKSFWEGTKEAKRSFVFSLVQAVPVARPQVKDSMRTTSYKYHLFDAESQCKLRVCKKMFDATIGIPSRTTLTWLVNQNKKTTPIREQPSGPQYDFEKLQKKILCAFLISLAKNTVQGNAKSVKEKKWNSQSELWRHYCSEVEKPVSLRVFIKTFKALELSLDEIAKTQ